MLTQNMTSSKKLRSFILSGDTNVYVTRQIFSFFWFSGSLEVTQQTVMTYTQCFFIVTLTLFQLSSCFPDFHAQSFLVFYRNVGVCVCSYNDSNCMLEEALNAQGSKREQQQDPQFNSVATHSFKASSKHLSCASRCGMKEAAMCKNKLTCR